MSGCTGGSDRTGIGADSGPVHQKDLFEGPIPVGFKKGGGRDFIGGVVFGFSDPENQIMTVSFDEFERVLGFGGGIKEGGLEFLNLLHIGSYCFESNMVSRGK